MKKALSGLLTAAGILGTCSLYENSHFVRKDMEIASTLLTPDWNGVKAVFLTDLHETKYGPANARLKQAITDADPDFVLVGGDMIIAKRGADPDFRVSTDLLRFLSGRWPVYYAIGNHEKRMIISPEVYPGWREKYFGVCRECGVTVLSNRSVRLVRGNSTLCLTGLDLPQVYYRRGNPPHMDAQTLPRLLGRRSEDAFCLLLAHNPRYAAEYARWGADCTLSGHDHGGLVRIPGLGGVVSPELRFFSPYTGDLITREGMPEIISAGLGTHTIHVRLNNRPQLIVLHFRGKKQKGVPCRPAAVRVRPLPAG